MRYALLSLLLLVAACTTPLEATVVPIPATGLKVGHQADVRGRGTIREFVPVDEDISNWRHLVTVQFFEGERRTPKEMAGKLEETARAHGGTLAWAIVEQDANSVLYEWSLLDCPKAGPEYRDQCEIARLLRGNDGLHRVAYTERARQMPAAAREKYLTAFRAAYVAKGSERKPIDLKP